MALSEPLREVDTHLAFTTGGGGNGHRAHVLPGAGKSDTI